MNDADLTLRQSLRYLRAVGEYDERVTVTTFTYRAGVVDAPAVRLWKVIEDQMLDEDETTWFVQVCGNPDEVVFATGDEAAAHERYALEVKAARVRIADKYALNRR